MYEEKTGCGFSNWINTLHRHRFPDFERIRGHLNEMIN